MTWLLVRTTTLVPGFRCPTALLVSALVDRTKGGLERDGDAGGAGAAEDGLTED
jgi:hypothetical protein